jgi:kynurenine formamidase
MKGFIDLSYTIENGMPVHPFDSEVKLYQDRFLEKNKYNNSRLETGMHAGTHIDIPRHLSNCNDFIDEAPVDKFIGNGCLLDVTNEIVITMKEEYREIVKENDIVLLYTGCDKEFGTESYFTSHPVVGKELAEFFIDKRIKMIGMDLPAPDKYPFEIHRMLFERGIFIIENMRNLDKLKNVSSFEIIAFPLKIKAEASLVRVVARL